VLSQPPGQSCAVVGGIMAIRMAKIGVKAVVVDGRVRDLGALAGCGVPVCNTLCSTKMELTLNNT
jgi:regulator of RNase E activity RraA